MLEKRLLDEHLRNEELVHQIQDLERQMAEKEQHQLDKKLLQSDAIQKLELDNQAKTAQNSDLKNQLKEMELSFINQEEVLKQEIEQLKEKTQKLSELENKVEIYQEKIKEIPELKTKLTQLVKQNIEYETMQGQEKLLSDENNKLQECIKYLNDQIESLKDSVNVKELENARMQQSYKEKIRAKDDEIKKLKKAAKQEPEEPQPDLDQQGFQLAILENKQLKVKISNLEKRLGETGGGLGYNPEFLKLQCEVNERDKQIALYKQRVSTLEANLQQLQTQNNGQNVGGMPLGHDMGDIDQHFDTAFN